MAFILLLYPHQFLICCKWAKADRNKVYRTLLIYLDRPMQHWTYNSSKRYLHMFCNDSCVLITMCQYMNQLHKPCNVILPNTEKALLHVMHSLHLSSLCTWYVSDVSGNTNPYTCPCLLPVNNVFRELDMDNATMSDVSKLPSNLLLWRISWTKARDHLCWPVFASTSTCFSQNLTTPLRWPVIIRSLLFHSVSLR